MLILKKNEFIDRIMCWDLVRFIGITLLFWAGVAQAALSPALFPPADGANGKLELVLVDDVVAESNGNAWEWGIGYRF
jgi:hypothetical protein